MTQEQQEMLIRKYNKQLKLCLCGDHATLARYLDGMIRLWMVKCDCGLRTQGCMHECQAVGLWNEGDAGYRRPTKPIVINTPAKAS